MVLEDFGKCIIQERLWTALVKPEYQVLFYLVETKAYPEISPLYLTSLLKPHRM